MKSPVPIILIFNLFTSILFSQSFQWEKVNGPFGGTALCFASHSNGYVFAGSDENQRGVYRSIDNGSAWQQKSEGIALSDRSVGWIVIDDSGYAVIGTNSHIGSRVYKSYDNGESWVETANLGGTSCAVNDSGHIYVGDTGYAQYSVSKDAGYTWDHYTCPSPFINCITINDSGHIFIGGNYTGYRSTDNGMTWTTLPLPDGINSIAAAPNGNLFAGSWREYASNSGVLRSTDNGDTWIAVKEGFRVNKSRNIVINDNGDILVGSWGGGIWKSTDDGDTWIQYNSGIAHLYVKSMYIGINGNVFAGLSGGGIYMSTNNGENWLQAGIAATTVKKIVRNPYNNDIFAAVSGVSHSTDGGQMWIPGGIGLSNYDIKSIAIKNGYIFAGTPQNNYGCLFRSSDNGVSWTRSDNGISNSSTNAISVSPSGDLYAGTSLGGIYYSTDNGDNWININYGVNLGSIMSLEINSGGDIFTASWGGGIYRKLSEDTVWNSLFGGYFTCLYVASNDYIYAEHSRSTDNGNTWTPMDMGSHRASSFTENSLGHLFAGTYDFGSGVWRSTDYGDSWEQINDGLPSLDVRSVAVDDMDFLYAGPNTHSLYKTTTSTVTGTNNIKKEPVSFYLYQNYPNPFNPETMIKYELPVRAHISLKVFDVLGKEIVTLISEEKPAGIYELNWNAAGLPSGIYFYQIRSGSFIGTRKMILLK